MRSCSISNRELTQAILYALDDLARLFC